MTKLETNVGWTLYILLTVVVQPTKVTLCKEDGQCKEKRTVDFPVLWLDAPESMTQLLEVDEDM